MSLLSSLLFKQKRPFRSIRSFFSFPGPKSLDQVVNVAKLEKAPTLEISQIWTEFHKFKLSSTSDFFSSEEWALLSRRATACPIFVIPIFKNVGFLSVLAQWQMPYLLVTSLKEYQVKKDKAMPYVTVTHFTELEKTKNVVLSRGEVNYEFVSKVEAADYLELVSCVDCGNGLKLIVEFD